MIKFVLESDLHYKKNGSKRSAKQGSSAKIVGIDADFVIVAGDLTDNGYDGSRIGCFRYGGFSNQLKPFIDDYVTPIEESGKDVYLCIGNHDRGRSRYVYKPVFRYVKKRHGGINYAFSKGNLRFICCGMYPKDLKFLKRKLRDNRPNIIFFHYNLQGQWSDWWTGKEKDAFYECIKDYDIRAICVGHSHWSGVRKWNDITVVSGAGYQVALFTYDPEIDNLDIRFV